MPQVLHRAINHPKPLPRGAWWAPVGRWLLPCPSRSSEASPIAFWAMALGCRLALLTLIPLQGPRLTITIAQNHGTIGRACAPRRGGVPLAQRRLLVAVGGRFCARGECRCPTSALSWRPQQPLSVTHSPPLPPSPANSSTRLRSLFLGAFRPLASYIAFPCVFEVVKAHGKFRVPYPPGWAILLSDTSKAFAAGRHKKKHR